jgi:hypothetical protein
MVMASLGTLALHTLYAIGYASMKALAHSILRGFLLKVGYTQFAYIFPDFHRGISGAILDHH